MIDFVEQARDEVERIQEKINELTEQRETLLSQRNSLETQREALLAYIDTVPVLINLPATEPVPGVGSEPVPEIPPEPPTSEPVPLQAAPESSPEPPVPPAAPQPDVPVQEFKINKSLIRDPDKTQTKIAKIVAANFASDAMIQLQDVIDRTTHLTTDQDRSRVGTWIGTYLTREVSFPNGILQHAGEQQDGRYAYRLRPGAADTLDQAITDHMQKNQQN